MRRAIRSQKQKLKSTMNYLVHIFSFLLISVIGKIEEGQWAQNIRLFSLGKFESKINHFYFVSSEYWKVELTLFQFLLITVSKGEIVLIQSPAYMTVSRGEKVIITCRASSSINSNYLHWYQQKPGASPKLLIYSTSYLAAGVLDSFSGSGSGNSYYLTISCMQDEDAATYYCQHGSSSPPHSATDWNKKHFMLLWPSCFLLEIKCGQGFDWYVRAFPKVL